MLLDKTKSLFKKVIVLKNIPISNNRMKSQSGCFTLHSGFHTTTEGKEYYKPLDLLEELNNKNDSSLEIIKIDKDKKNKILNELDILGINRYTIYPEITSYFEYLKTSRQ